MEVPCVDSETYSDDINREIFGNPNWVHSISKILKANNPNKKKTLVLSKAKKLTDLPKSKIHSVGFEVETLNGNVKEKQTVVCELEAEKPQQTLLKKQKDLPSVRVKPNILDKDKEQILIKIATRGIVQLFNAVKKQQKDVSTKLKEAGALDVKHDKVLKNIDKREFLNVLMGHKTDSKTKSNKSENSQKKSSEGQTWQVFRDDFMMEAKLKDWDKEMEIENDVKMD